ncbi:MAG: serine/threonine protein kinase [Myxococcota bacterium]|nr:serine/threonine protein kinase [Myxococcota bacterium]
MEAAPERYGSYVVYEQIGKGGMATVHRAELSTREGKQEVALKRLLPTMQKELVALFLDEARLLRYLKHPNIATTFDSGRVFGTYFIAMEYVRGPTLKELVEHCAVTTGSVPQAITLNLGAQLCDALDHAHNRCDEQGKPLGIIHRDVTPANIIISDTGTLKLFDFGLAKAKNTTEQTAVGVIKGKFGYVAPEYTKGTLDHRADLWAIGIIMYELLTSRRLFDGADAFETMMRVREMPIPRPSLANPQVMPALDEIVMTALARDPERRWPSAAAMRDRIHAVIARPGNTIDNQGVADWVRWVFEQKRGRPPQLTPMMPMPFAQLIPMDDAPTQISGPLVIDDNDFDAEEPVSTGDPLGGTRAVGGPWTWSRENLIWCAGAGALALFLLVMMIVKIVT